jgi:hypothetical protein
VKNDSVARRVSIVPHTHWDREWYLPFQTFRMRLVILLDRLLPRLEADPGYAHFLLDGQMAAVDDYLAVRPEARSRLERLVRAGRLAMGPWYTLPDEFLVSGETLVRNLQLGLATAARLGGAMDVGYLPDMFGHVAQMPQILSGFGFADAVVWRGVPAAIDRTAFWWSAPDGSTVRAEYLPTGYGNGSATPRDPAALLERLEAWETEHASMLDGGPLLWMNGTDHEVPQPWLPEVVAAANDNGQYDLVISSLADHLRSGPTDGLPAWMGELRSGARANVLMGVTSNRVDVRVAAARAEQALERIAEPLAALFTEPDEWPGALLDEAWLAMIRNAAHDSVCACSVDEVCTAVLHRYHEARQIAEGITHASLTALARSLTAPGWVAVNPTARARSGVVEVVVFGDVPDGAQVVRREPARREMFRLRGDSARAVLGDMVGWTPGIGAVTFTQTDDGSIEVVLHADGAPGEAAVRAAVVDRLAALQAHRPDAEVRCSIAQVPSTVVALRTPVIEGFGWSPVHGAAPDDPPAAIVDAATLSNGVVTVRVNEWDGTYSIDGVSGLGRLVDGGDAGDTYNYDPPANDVLVEGPAEVRLEPIEAGPVRASLRVVSTYCWPDRVNAGTRHGNVMAEVATTLTIVQGERLVRVTTELTNRARDHRLRVHFPLPEKADRSRAECAFAVVERGLHAEGGPTERALPTFPSRRFVQAGGLTFVHEGLHEYELVDIDRGGASELAVTLLRATGWLSRGPMAYRPLPAGPEIATEGSQVQGHHTLRYGLVVGPCDPFAAAEDLHAPLMPAFGSGGGWRRPSGSALTIRGAEVISVRRNAGAVEARVVAMSEEPGLVDTGGRGGWLVDLRGRPLEPFQGTFTLRPWGIATLRFSE